MCPWKDCERWEHIENERIDENEQIVEGRTTLNPSTIDVMVESLSKNKRLHG